LSEGAEEVNIYFAEGGGGIAIEIRGVLNREKRRRVER
jgi:hypothetical protein